MEAGGVSKPTAGVYKPTDLGVNRPIGDKFLLTPLEYKPQYESSLSLVNPALASDEQWVPSFRVRRYLADGLGFKGGDYHPAKKSLMLEKKRIALTC